MGNRRSLNSPGALLGLMALLALPGGVQAQGLASTGEACRSCHESSEVSPRLAVEHGDVETCNTCHHIGFTNDPVESRARRLETCRSCHEDLHLTDSHAAADVRPDCTGCHTIHPDQLGEPSGAVLAGDCGVCHTDLLPGHAPVKAEGPGCGDCHSEHEPAAPAEACLSCHEDAGGVHLGAEGETPDCLTCHATHAEGAWTPPSVEDVSAGCVTCHEAVHPSHAAVSAYQPTCADCHAFHGDGAVEESTHVIAGRCQACHEDQAAEFASGGHARGLTMAGSERDVPDCATCHTAHPDPEVAGLPTRLAATVRCLECHGDDLLMESYDLTPGLASSFNRDFHGQTLQFLWKHPETQHRTSAVMVCSDCHGAHGVAWLEPAEVSDVCLECHEDAGVLLAGAWLGHDRIGPRNAPIVWIIRVFYMFLIPFMLGGLTLNILFHLFHQRKHGARMANAEGVKRFRDRIKGRGEEIAAVVRFNEIERLEHAGSLLTFVALVVTGLPQIYPQNGLAGWIVGALGGIQITRYIHRAAGVVFVLLMAGHVIRGVTNAIRRRRLPEIAPERKDFQDAIDAIKHHISGTPKPKMKKFAFDQKFEYWGLFLGGMAMSATGLILLFPDLLTQILPGMILAIAKTIHGLEGTFAVLVVVVWHSWGVILRPEIFPLDTTIFTGKMSVERLRDEHALEFERIFGIPADSGDEVVAPSRIPPPQPRRVSRGPSGAFPAD